MLCKRQNTKLLHPLLTLIVAALFGLLACERRSSSGNDPTATAPTDVLKSVEEATAEGYRLKQRGDNRAALAKFRVAEKLIRNAQPVDRYQLASGLDDQASVHLRTGDHHRAKELFDQAAGLLENLNHPRAPGLLDGVKWRLRIQRALERHGITCGESDSYSPAHNHMRPYFPGKEELLKAVGGLNPQVRDCYQGKAKPVTVSLVVTGEGRIVLSDARGASSNKSASLCAAERLLKLGQVPNFPKFGACFRPLTYPFVVGGI